MMQILLPLTIIATLLLPTANAFSAIQRPIHQSQTRRTHSTSRCNNVRLCATGFGGGDAEAGAKKKKKKGDSIRDATGIRSSLHPVTINCIAEALLLRSQCALGKTVDKEGKPINIDTSNIESDPLEIALTAGALAVAAIDQRASASEKDETTDAFSLEESQVISGRVVGVIMRMRELEQLLLQKATGAKWVVRYGEQENFGLLKKECTFYTSDENDEQSTTASDEEVEKALAELIKLNPLFRMNRAECLLALFLETVEKPKMEELGQTVPGGSEVDFIDGDRLEVLIG